MTEIDADNWIILTLNQLTLKNAKESKLSIILAPNVPVLESTTEDRASER